METTKREKFTGKTLLPSTIKTAPLTEGETSKIAKIIGEKLTEKLLASMVFTAG
jgi:hypothetical protein